MGTPPDFHLHLARIRREYSPTSWDKGTFLVEGGLIRQDEDNDLLFWVTNEREDTTYRVQLIPPPDLDLIDIPWMSCDCPNGQHLGGRPRCYHTAAVFQLLLEEWAERQEKQREHENRRAQERAQQQNNNGTR